MSEFQVMKATAAQPSDFRFPLLASPKVDGFRGYVLGAQLRARSNKRVANRATEKFLSQAMFEGLDGELVVGSPTAKDLFQVTTSALRSEQGDPRAVFLVFDCIDARLGFSERLAKVDAIIKRLPSEYATRVVKLTQVRVENLDALLEFEERCLALGFEGIMLRDPNGRYKQGRSTIAERGLLKLKRFSDSEAVIIGKEEEVEGSTQRKKGTLGAFNVRDVESGIEFSVGTGFSAAQRAAFWKQDLTGEIIKYKYFKIGMVERSLDGKRSGAPRFPTFLGFRAAVDM